MNLIPFKETPVLHLSVNVLDFRRGFGPKEDVDNMQRGDGHELNMHGLVLRSFQQCFCEARRPLCVREACFLFIFLLLLSAVVGNSRCTGVGLSPLAAVLNVLHLSVDC